MFLIRGEALLQIDMLDMILMILNLRSRPAEATPGRSHIVDWRRTPQNPPDLPAYGPFSQMQIEALYAPFQQQQVDLSSVSVLTLHDSILVFPRLIN